MKFGFNPSQFRSDEETCEEIAAVQSSLQCDIDVYGVIGGSESSFGLCFTVDVFGWEGECSTHWPVGTRSYIHRWKKN